VKHPFVIKDGDKLAVLRPKDPQLALKLAYAAMEIEDTDAQNKAFQEVLNAQPYSFVGLMSTVGKPDRKLLDEDGWAIGKVRPGDSFVPYAQVLAHTEAVAKGILEGDPNAVITDPEKRERPGVWKFEVQKDGTIGPVREKM
jgi:hypothetical protein